MKLEDARQEIERFRVSSGQFIRCLSADISSGADLSHLIPQAIKEFGTPDILINSAGIISCDYFGNISYDSFDAVMKINLYASRNMIAEVLPAMKKRGGYIVIISLVAGLMGMYGYTAYGTSKFVLVGFAEFLKC